MTQRLYPNLLAAVIGGLRSIFAEGRQADKVIEHLLRSNPKWGSRDRAFIAMHTYNMVRHWRLLWALTGREPEPLADDFHFYQLFAAYWWHHTGQLPDLGMKLPQVSVLEQRLAAAQAHRPHRESVPDWMDELGVSELGESVWERELAALNQPAEVVLRANTIKTTHRQLAQALAEAGLSTRPVAFAPDALVLESRQNIFRQPLFLSGHFEVQDASSQLVAPYLKPEPGMRVIDACAGAGGKSLHLAALMGNKGRLLSLDVEEYKLAELNRRARRAGIQIAETRLIEGSKTIKRLEGSAERLLLDVPCSGMGVLRRNPDSKWKLQPAFLEQVRQTQQEILQSYSRMLAPGGLMVYATCSLLPSENQQQVQTFLDWADGRFERLSEQSILPSAHGFDGFFMALLRKN